MARRRSHNRYPVYVSTMLLTTALTTISRHGSFAYFQASSSRSRRIAVSRLKTTGIVGWGRRQTSLFSSSTVGHRGSMTMSLDETNPFFDNQYKSFGELGLESERLVRRLSSLQEKLPRPSAVQAASYSRITSTEKEKKDIVIGAETGSGKTLAYLLPLVDEILSKKERGEELGYDYCRAVILVPNKELAGQVLRMTQELCGGKVVWPPTADESTKEEEKDASLRLAILPGGLSSPRDFKPFRDGLNDAEPQVDLLICTPAAMAPWGINPKYIPFFSSIETLVIDEADMLLDGGYIPQLNQVLLGFRRADKFLRRGWEMDDEFIDGYKTQHIFVGATLPDSGLRSVYAYILKKFPFAEQIMMPGMHNARHYGLQDKTTWIEEPDYGNRVDKVVMLLQNELRQEKVMVFVNTAQDVDEVTAVLKQQKINAIPYHAKVPQSQRVSNLSLFRNYNPQKDSTTSPPILICTDLASRGLDIPDVTTIIQLQFAENVVAHLHRMGRCGRAGNKNGRGIIFYHPKEKDLVDVVQLAESQQEKMVLEKDVMDDEDEQLKSAKVDKAFSRKRGFRKKLKKNLKKEMEMGSFPDDSS